MNFLIDFLTKTLSKIFNVFINKNNQSNTNINVNRTENTSWIAKATAVILLVCAVALAIYWIPQFIVADIFWVKSCIKVGHIIEFPVKADKLFEMIYSLLGLGAVGIMHKFIKR
jgi:fatty acid desaturase